jgi:hypothetical protein
VRKKSKIESGKLKMGRKRFHQLSAWERLDGIFGTEDRDRFAGTAGRMLALPPS